MPSNYCQNCGARLLPKSRFCVECGTRSGSAAPAALPRLRMDRYGPLIVVACVLAVGGGAIVTGSLSAKPPPNVPPRSSSGAGRMATASAGGQELPPDHPPISLPADVREKIRQLAEEAKAQPDNLEAWKQVAMVQYRAGLVDPSYLSEAAKSFEHVLGREPENLEALRSMGNISYDQNKPDIALEYYRKYLALRPNDPEVMTDMGTMYLSQREIPKAIDTYKKVLEANPTFFQAQFNLAIAYRGAGDHAASIAAMEKARDLAPEDAKPQIEQLIARSKAEPAPAAPTGAAAPPAPTAGPAVQPAAAIATGTFQEDVEAVFRQHQMVGPKLDRIEWPEARAARVVVRDFPMEAMPPFARQMFADRIGAGVKAARERHKEDAALKIELVDAASGKVMETLNP